MKRGSCGTRVARGSPLAWPGTTSSHRFTDASLEGLYRPFREAVAARLTLAPGQHVIDAGCGTGQSFDVLSPAAGPEGLVVGVFRPLDGDAAQGGPARRAQGILERASRPGFAAHAGARLARRAPPAGRGFDRGLCFLVLTALPEWERATDRVWDLIEPGGVMVIADTHADPLGFQGRLVNLTARADIRRRVWSRLESLSEDFSIERLAAPSSVGGDIVVARGRKPARPTPTSRGVAPRIVQESGRFSPR